MCFVWISEQTANISLYSINWLVCITETECLLGGTDCIFKDISGLFGPLFVVDAVTLGQVCFRVILFSPVSIIPPFHHCSMLIFIDVLLLWEGQTGEVWEPSKQQCYGGNLRTLGKCLHMFNARSVRQNVGGWHYSCWICKSCCNNCYLNLVFT